MSVRLPAVHLVRFPILASAALIAACGVATPPTPAAAAPEDGGAGADTAARAGDEADAAPGVRPDWCVVAEQGVLQDVTTTPRSPYFVHHPDAAVADPATVVFVPGGPGSRDTAQATFELWLSRGSTLGRFRVIVPYADDGDLTDEGDRIVPILDEVLACHGGAAARVHLAGTSNGGRAAFALMLKSHERFVTLLGAPGVFDAATDAQLTTALAGKAVFNGAGALDGQWRPLVKATHDWLVSLGVDSVLVEFPGQGHILNESADQEPFFGFWSQH